MLEQLTLEEQLFIECARELVVQEEDNNIITEDYLYNENYDI